MNAAVKNPPVTFAEAFCKLQAQIKPAIKDTTNPHFGKKYADLSSVWDAVREPLQENGFSVIQSPNFEGDTMWLETIIMHSTGEKIAGRYPIRPVKPDPQGVGSAISYARRYSLSAMLGVIQDDDDGNAASAPAPKPSAAAPTQSQAIHTPMQLSDDDREQAKNWCADQKALLDASLRLPNLTDWLDAVGGRRDRDENGKAIVVSGSGDWAKPFSGSGLARLKSKFPEAFNDLKSHYMERMKDI